MTPATRQASATASCWSMAAWPRTSARSWKWSPRSTCCAADAEWQARQQAHRASCAHRGGLCARATCASLAQPPRAISTARSRPSSPGPPTTTRETLIERVRGGVRRGFLGLLMLGGMSGGGMGFIFDPRRKPEAQDRLQDMMSDTKRRTARRAALRHGAGGLRFRHQRPRHGGHAPGRRRGLYAAGLLCAVRAAVAAARHPRSCPGRPRAKSTASPPPAARIRG